MGVHEVDFQPATDEPAVRHPQLRTLVDAARAQPPPSVGLDAEALHAAWVRQRARRRWRIGAGLVAAASIVLVAGLWLPSDDPMQASPSHDSGAVAEVMPSPPAGGPSAAPSTEVVPEAAPEPSPRLAERIDVSPLDDGPQPFEILGSHRLRLPPGRWSVDTRADAVVEVVVPGRILELRGGHVHVQVAGDVARVEVLREEVVQLDARGHRMDAAAGSEPAPTRRASAEELARQAEVHMAAGRRGEAIKSLRRLVTRYPRSGAAQAGLIDLGRLLERAGQPDRARCAYATFLERWPGHSLRGDVAAAHRALGQGPECRGLRPRR